MRHPVCPGPASCWDLAPPGGGETHSQPVGSGSAIRILGRRSGCRTGGAAGAWTAACLLERRVKMNGAATRYSPSFSSDSCSCSCIFFLHYSFWRNFLRFYFGSYCDPCNSYFFFFWPRFCFYSYSCSFAWFSFCSYSSSAFCCYYYRWGMLGPQYSKLVPWPRSGRRGRGSGWAAVGGYEGEKGGAVGRRGAGAGRDPAARPARACVAALARTVAPAPPSVSPGQRTPPASYSTTQISMWYNIVGRVVKTWQ